MAKRTPKKLVALSSTAIAAIYMAGYLTTSGADASLAVIPTPSPFAAPSPFATPTLTVASSVPTIGPTRVPSPTATLASGYRDGTYAGSGDSRRGGFDVALTIQAGRIANVQITRAWTQYPASRVAALPGQVIARQSAQVDRVSGATYSVGAFQQAVQQALAQAGSAPQGGAPVPGAGVGGPSSPSIQPVQPLNPRGVEGGRRRGSDDDGLRRPSNDDSRRRGTDDGLRPGDGGSGFPRA